MISPCQSLTGGTSLTIEKPSPAFLLFFVLPSIKE